MAHSKVVFCFRDLISSTSIDLSISASTMSSKMSEFITVISTYMYLSSHVFCERASAYNVSWWGIACHYVGFPSSFLNSTSQFSGAFPNHLPIKTFKTQHEYSLCEIVIECFVSCL